MQNCYNARIKKDKRQQRERIFIYLFLHFIFISAWINERNNLSKQENISKFWINLQSNDVSRKN